MTKTRRVVAALAIFIGVTMLYYASNPRLPDAYKHHVYVADAWLHGRLDVQGYPGHYHDWIRVDGKVHSPFAPTPAILLVPFVWWWGTAINMNFFSMAVAGFNAMLCWILLMRAGVGSRRAALGTLIFAFCTVNWFSAIIGTTWFLAHLCTELFLLLALIEVFGKGRAWLVGAAFGFAMLARANVVTAAPGVFFLLVHRQAVRQSFFRFFDGRAIWRGVLFTLGIAVPIGIELWLNYTRFGNPFDTGYGKAAEIYMSGKKYGWYDWHYISQHVHIAVFKGWEYIEEFPFLKPSPEGLSILLTSPVLLYAFAAPRRDPIVRLLWLATALTAAALVPYFYQGWVQFGYRYLLDALPYVIVLTAMGMRDRGLLPLLFLAESSALLNALGVYWGKKLGW